MLFLGKNGDWALLDLDCLAYIQDLLDDATEIQYAICLYLAAVVCSGLWLISPEQAKVLTCLFALVTLLPCFTGLV